MCLFTDGSRTPRRRVSFQSRAYSMCRKAGRKLAVLLTGLRRRKRPRAQPPRVAMVSHFDSFMREYELKQKERFGSTRDS